VNPAHVRRIQRLPSGEAVLTLASGEALRVSRGYRAALDAFAP
jgi:DNA-binding LytR/AlgR family response regulator